MELQCYGSGVAGRLRLILILTVVTLWPIVPALPAQGADGPGGARSGPGEQSVEAELVKYVTVVSPINEAVAARVTNAALELQHRAEQRDRTAVLILEIGRGTSKFGQVLDLAKELASARFSRVRTVAWVPLPPDRKPVDGYHVLLVLACKEVVMHPDAEMGDMGRGDALPPEEQHAILGIVQKRQNPKVSRALALGLMDPAQTVLKVKLERKEDGTVTTDRRVVTLDELKRLRDTFQGNIDVETIWETGEVGLLSGSRARALDVLIAQTARS
ncbi:MAG TPA: hypothetical protein EYP14_14895, partial [Planctomycetaceae bacterium]|nr:hypothetical protein [Planctomycetaceae bacterium]